MRVCYVDLDVVDCTADPHVLSYDAVEMMLEDVLKVCESDVVKAINVVRLKMGKLIEIATEHGTTSVWEETYESDYYSDSPNEKSREPARGAYARKHKVEGLYFWFDSPYEGKTEETYRTPDGREVKVKVGKLPIGLSGVKKAIELIKNRLKTDPTFRNFVLEIGVVWDEFGAHNCSDYITADGSDMTVDYSNQDWYVGEEGYERHIRRLAEILGLELEDL